MSELRLGPDQDSRLFLREPLIPIGTGRAGKPAVFAEGTRNEINSTSLRIGGDKMTQDEILALFRNSGALLEGHFRLSSGLHSSRYLQCALVLQHPDFAATLGSALAARMSQLAGLPGLVIAPALGGILVAHEVARALGVRALFVERQEGALVLRRGFRIESGETCFVVEDVVTTGGSTRETMDVVARSGGVVTAAGAIIDRSGGRTDLGVPKGALAILDVPNYSPDDCPMCRSGSQAVKPGSR